MQAPDESSYTSGAYFQHNPDWHVSDSPWKARHIASLLNENHISGTRICEVGCGAGEILAQLQRELPAGIDYFGYEISPQAHALSLQRANDHLVFRLQDILEEKNEMFDLILAIDVMEHVADYFGFLRGLKDKARNFVFHIPLDLSVSSIMRPRSFLKVRKDVGHLHYFNRETALATLADCGYRVLDSRLTAGALEVSGRYGSIKTKLANLPRRIAGTISPLWAGRMFGGWSLLALAE